MIRKISDLTFFRLKVPCSWFLRLLRVHGLGLYISGLRLIIAQESKFSSARELDRSYVYISSSYKVHHFTACPHAQWSRLWMGFLNPAAFTSTLGQ